MASLTNSTNTEVVNNGEKRSPFTPLTKDQILEDLKTSREQYENGEYLDFDEALDEIEAKYGI